MTTAAPVNAMSLPTAGASPALEAVSIKDQGAAVGVSAPVLMSVGDVSADKFTSVHSDAASEVALAETQSEVEDTVYVEEMPEEEQMVSENDLEYANLVIAQVNDYVNVRSDASEDAEIVGKLYDKSVGTFLSEKDGWYEIASGNCRGYHHNTVRQRAAFHRQCSHRYGSD